jgi:hypothetical protein
MELRVHLKICEACGCLWYRAQLESRVYCTTCNERFKEFPTPQSRKRRGRPRKAMLPTVFAVQASVEMIFQERLAAANNTSYVERASCAGRLLSHLCKNPLPADVAREIPLALLASGAGVFSGASTQLGGAQ